VYALVEEETVVLN